MALFTNQPLSRRHVLRGLGTCLSLPLLDAMIPRASAAPSKFRPWEKSYGVHPRMICCYVPNGVNMTEWKPTEQGSNYTFSPTLEVLKDHREDFSVISGLGHPASQGGHSGADTWLTGADLQAVPGSDFCRSGGRRTAR
jgi:hypothetical protein